ncbi:MAG: recF [Solirubrobacterales bacterium]|nr:recF [Solirubrobacterales bacterium]
MLVTRLRLRDFRSHATADVALGERITVVHGPNGAGKTNLLEGLYFGCTGRSCRTTNERDVVRFDAPAARAEVSTRDRDGTHELSVGFAAGEAKRFKVDGAPVERLLDSPARPLVSVFLPDRLELVKGPPALRRSHLDQVVGALWPTRTATRRAYGQALAQRNALLGRLRAGLGSRASMATWDLELARHAIALRSDRARAVELLAPRLAGAATELGLAGVPELRYRPRSKAASAEELAAELAERLDGDLERGFTGHGPHRDDLALLRDGRELRSFGSQGEQRLALLALLLAERSALEDERGAAPLLLLDDVMSELDATRREFLVERLQGAGQSLITTTELAHVPGARKAGVVRLRVEGGSVTPDHAETMAA